jgi:hypothetical protein
MTAQSYEKLHYQGELMNMAALPLSDYLRTRDDLKFWGLSTGNLRGYEGEWKIVDNKLILVGLNGLMAQPRLKKVTLKDLFPEQKEVFAGWFSGEVRVPQGELLDYVHMGFASTYERDLMLVFENGILVHEYVINNSNNLKLDDDILIREEWVEKVAWDNRAYLNKLEGLSTNEIELESLRNHINRIISPQLAIAGHLKDKTRIRKVCRQILSLLRFIPEKERNHKVELMRAAFGFDYDITGDFVNTSETFAKYQKKLDFRKKWLWFLPLKQLTYPEDCN